MQFFETTNKTQISVLSFVQSMKGGNLVHSPFLCSWQTLLVNLFLEARREFRNCQNILMVT